MDDDFQLDDWLEHPLTKQVREEFESQIKKYQADLEEIESSDVKVTRLQEAIKIRRETLDQIRNWKILADASAKYAEDFNERFSNPE